MQLCRFLTVASVLALGSLTPAAPTRLLQHDAAPTERPAPSRVAPIVRYRFKDPLPVELALEHVAVRAPGGLDPARVPPALDPLGVEEMATPGWHLVRLHVPATAETIDALLEELVTETDWDFVTPVFRDEVGPYFVTPQILIGFEESADYATQETVLRSALPEAVLERDWAGMRNAYCVRSSERNGLRVLETANALAQRADVLFAEPDFLFTVRLDQTPPNDPMFAFSWGLHSTGALEFDTDFDMGVLEAWTVTQGDPSVRVLVLDTGIDPAHPDLNQDPGEDFTGQGTGGAPGNACDNHGTVVAGCISAIADNGLGSAGVAPLCKSVSARVIISNPACNLSGQLMSSWIVRALDWGYTNGIRITNASFGSIESSAVSAKYQSTHAQGMVHFASAGNGGGNLVSYPARAPGVIAIGAVEFDGRRASFSSYGVALDLMAPGVAILTTDRSGAAGWHAGDYILMVGTSLSSPLAAGVAALMRSVQPSLTPAAIESLLQQSTRDLETAGWDVRTGWGMIRADRALGRLLSTDLSSIDPDPRHSIENLRTCDWPAFSNDCALMAFASYSPELVASDTNGKRDVFLRDNQTETIARVSVASSGAQANDESRSPSISANGRYVAFESWARNLLDSGDTNGRRDVFLRDVSAGTTVRVSVSSSGSQANGESGSPAISADGRYIAFHSVATNLDPAPTSGVRQIYVRDELLGTTKLISKTSAGVAGNGHSHFPSISDDGRRVAFSCFATNLVAVHGPFNVVLHDAPTNSLSLVNVDSSGTPTPGQTLFSAISRDGNRVAFTTDAAIVPSDSNGSYDVYVRDVSAAATLAGSVDPGGTFGDRDSYAGALSLDGRYLIFASAAASFDPGDHNEQVDVFRKDLQSGAIIRISVGPAGKTAAGSGQPWISPSGDRVGFTSRDDALVPGDAIDGASDIYLRNIPAGTTKLLTSGS